MTFDERVRDAAPGLLAALKEIVAYDEGSNKHGDFGYEVLQRCKTAIAKAEGRSDVMAHTPGPWTVGGQSDNPGEAEEIAAADRVIAWTADSYDYDDDEGHITQEDRANARLIAAAPELLAALRSAVTILSGWECTHKADDGDTETVRLCKAAIAKAEGRSE